MAHLVTCYFGGMQELDEEDCARIYGDSQYLNKRPISLGHTIGRFKTFLKSVKAGSYYLFILSNNQLALWNKHVTRYDLAKYEVYRNPIPIPNRNYGMTAARLNLFIFKFDEDFVKKWSEA